MKTRSGFLTTVAFCLCSTVSMAPLEVARGQANAPKPFNAAPDLRAGHTFLVPRVFTEEEDQRVLKLFEGLR